MLEYRYQSSKVSQIRALLLYFFTLLVIVIKCNFCSIHNHLLNHKYYKCYNVHL